MALAQKMMRIYSRRLRFSAIRGELPLALILTNILHRHQVISAGPPIGGHLVTECGVMDTELLGHFATGRGPMPLTSMPHHGMNPQLSSRMEFRTNKTYNYHCPGVSVR
jgi:hypothetical protein